VGPRCTPALRSWLGGSTGAPVYVLRDDSGGVDVVRTRHPDPGGRTGVGSWPGETTASYARSLWTVGRPPSLITPASRMMDR
jgi:hypothetical protein